MILAILLLFLLSVSMSGQRYYITNRYVYDMFLMNPGNAGDINSSNQISAYFQKQWFGVDLAPTTQILTYQTPLKTNLGSGTYIYNDRNGYNKKIGFQQSISVKVLLRDNMRGPITLSFGLSAYIEQALIDQSGFTGGVGGDPIINGGVESGLGFNANSGLILRVNKYELGAAFTNMLPQSNPLYENVWEPDLPVDIHLHSSYKFKIPNRDLFLEPLIYYRRNSLPNSRMDVNVKMTMPTPDPDLAFW